jgi:hypothetical protein
LSSSREPGTAAIAALRIEIASGAIFAARLNEPNVIGASSGGSIGVAASSAGVKHRKHGSIRTRRSVANASDPGGSVIESTIRTSTAGCPVVFG